MSKFDIGTFQHQKSNKAVNNKQEGESFIMSVKTARI